MKTNNGIEMNEKRDWTKTQMVRTIRLKELTETEALWEFALNPANEMERRRVNLAIIMEELQTQRREALEIAALLWRESEEPDDNFQFELAMSALSEKLDPTER